MPIALTPRCPRLFSTSTFTWCGLAALAVVLGTRSIPEAAAVGDTRTISMHHIHTDEDITITYKRDGKYDEAALKKLDHFLRDWRRNEETRMDPRLIDIVYDVWQESGTRNPVWIVCGYRAPATNAMLRRRSKGVAKFSQHTLGHAIDFYIPGASLEHMRYAGLRLQRGGVGYYPTSGSPFIHLDVGSIRHWPRMSHEQLARVFPDGRTVHIPSDGKPLKNYELALADIQRRGSSPSENSLNAARAAGIAVASAPKQKNILASLFKGKDDDEDEPTASAKNEVVAAIPVASETVRKETAKVAMVPLPVRRPAEAIPATATRVATVATAATSTASASARITQAVAAVPPAAPGTVAAVTAPSPPMSAVAARWDEANSLRQISSLGELQVASLTDASQVTGYTSMAYATVEKSAPAKPVSQGLHFTRRANASELTSDFARPSANPVKSAAVTMPPPAPATASAPGVSDIWLRAVMLAPDLQHYLSATLMGSTDPKDLSVLIQKPKTALALTFSDDPMAGIVTDQFTGDAVVFIDTVTFSNRTAALR